MKRSLSVIFFVLMSALIAASAAQAEVFYPLNVVSPSQNCYVIGKVAKNTYGDDISTLEFSLNGTKWTKTLPEYVYPRSAVFSGDNTVFVIAYRWMGNDTILYAFDISVKKLIASWTFDEGDKGKVLPLGKSLIFTGIGLNVQVDRVYKAYIIGDYTKPKTKPVLIKEFTPNVVDMYLGYQQKNSTYSGFAVMTVDAFYQAYAYRITAGTVEDEEAGFRQLTFWSEVENFRIVEGIGLLARISELTFDLPN